MYQVKAYVIRLVEQIVDCIDNKHNQLDTLQTLVKIKTCQTNKSIPYSNKLGWKISMHCPQIAIN